MATGGLICGQTGTTFRRIGQAVLEKKIFENGGRWTDGRPWLYYKLTNEPKGSGELTMQL